MQICLAQGKLEITKERDRWLLQKRRKCMKGFVFLYFMEDVCHKMRKILFNRIQYRYIYANEHLLFEWRNKVYREEKSRWATVK